MTIKTATLTAILASALVAGASAETMIGRVYSVSDSDVYIRMPNSVVARVPADTAHFYINDQLMPWNTLRTGQFVRVEYQPIYGFQHLYKDANAADVDLADGNVIWYEGSTDQVFPEDLPMP